MKKVAIILNNDLKFPLREGIRKETWWFAKEFEKRNFEVSIYVFNSERYNILKKENIKTKENIKIIDTNIYKLKYIKADYIYLFSAPTIDYIFILRAKYNKMFMFIFDGECNRFWKSRFSKLFQKLIDKKIRYYFIQTEYQKQILKKYVKMEKIKKIVPLYINDINNNEIENRKDKRILFMSHFGDEKGIKELLEAYKKLYDKDKKWELVIANSGIKKNEEVEKNIDELKKKGYNIKKKGIVRPFQELKKAEFFIYTFKKANNTFSIPLSLIEAMESGTKFISTNVGGIKEYFDEKYLLDEITPDKIAEKILFLKDKKNDEIIFKIDNNKIMNEIINFQNEKIAFVTIKNKNRPHFVHNEFAKVLNSEEIGITLEEPIKLKDSIKYAIKNCRKYLNKYDVLFLNGGQTLFINFLIKIFSKKEIKTIYINADPLFHEYKKLIFKKKIFYRLLFWKVDGLISVSKYNYEKSMKILKKPNYIVTPFYDLLTNSEKNKDENLFIFLGKNRDEKNIKNMISGFNLFAKEFKNSKLIIVGIERNEINFEVNCENIEFVGRILREKTIEYYEKAKYLLLFSYNDSFPVVILEAMSQRVLPIISENIGNSYLLDDRLKLSKDKLNVSEKIADKIKEVYLMPEIEKNKIIEENFQTAKMFSKEKILNKLKRSFFKILEEV